jgi:Holliday junction resolvase RusA-like endonuclease
MTITVPWAILEHDNHRLMPVRLRGGKVRNITAPKYRAAKTSVALLFLAVWRGAPLVGPVQVHGRAFFPDRRKRDAGNYRKLLTDALSGIAYDDDEQITREIWDKAGLDRTAPRIELTITSRSPLSETP